MTETRKELGLSINEMAELMGVHRQTLVKWERGERQPDNSAVRHMELLVWLRENHPDALGEWKLMH